MLSVIPAGIFSRLRIFLGRLKPHALPVARRHIVLIHWRRHRTGGDQHVQPLAARRSQSVVYCPDGASAVLLFGVPSSPLAQPWSIVGGNVLSALIGVTVGMLVPDAAGLRSGGGSGHRRDVFSALSSPAARWLTAISAAPGAQLLSLCADPGAPQLADAGAAGYCV